MVILKIKIEILKKYKQKGGTMRERMEEGFYSWSQRKQDNN